MVVENTCVGAGQIRFSKPRGSGIWITVVLKGRMVSNVLDDRIGNDIGNEGDGFGLEDVL